MSRRADRLFEIIQVLRRARRPLTADALAAELETSKRTVYRDIAALVRQRVPIRGEAGIGYVLERSFELPPLALTADEIEAVVLGTQWVSARSDVALARAASSVLDKIALVIPPRDRHLIDDPVVGTPGKRKGTQPTIDAGKLRKCCQQGLKVRIAYEDGGARQSERVVWPFLVGYHDTVEVLIAWCELRLDFRIFRLDRLRSVEFLNEFCGERPATLRRRWLTEIETKR